MGLVNANQIANIAKRYLTDTSITEVVTYKSITSSYDEDTLENTETEVEIDTRALVSILDRKELARYGGINQLGDVQFIIAATELSSITPSTSDRINYDGSDWDIVNIQIHDAASIKNIKIGSTEIMYIFSCRR